MHEDMMGSHKSETIKSEGTGNHFSEWLLFYYPKIEIGGERKLHSGRKHTYWKNIKEMAEVEATGMMAELQQVQRNVRPTPVCARCALIRAKKYLL